MKAFGYRLVFNEGYWEYRCRRHRYEGDDGVEVVEFVTLGDLREEGAYWCNVCEDLILPSLENWESESTEEERQRFEASGIDC